MPGTVTIEEARQILGATIGTMSDVQISKQLAVMNDLANNWLDTYEKKIFGQTLSSLLHK